MANVDNHMLDQEEDNMHARYSLGKTAMFVFGLLLILLLSACASYTPTSVPAPATATTLPPTIAPTSPPPTTAPTTAPAAQLEKVKFAGGAPLPGIVGYLPADVANALGLFKEEGLGVTLLSGLSRSEADNALTVGSVDFAVLGIDQPISWQGTSRPQRMVVEFTRLPDLTLVVRSDMKEKIKSVTDLKGQKIAYPDGLALLMPYITAKAGLEPGDAPVDDMGGVVAEVEALQKGTWVAAIELDPYTTQLTKPGTAYALVDLRTEAESTKWLGGEYPNFGLVTSADMIQNHPQTVQKMTNALVKALRYIATHSAADIAAILPNDVTGNDKALYIEALQQNLSSYSKDGIVSEAGVKNAIEVNKALGAIKPNAQINVSALYTNDFVNNVK
jgi:NitT/TauT family transport system substrate-binding protein